MAIGSPGGNGVTATIVGALIGPQATTSKSVIVTNPFCTTLFTFIGYAGNFINAFS